MRTVLLTLVALLLVTGLRSEGEAEWKKRHEWARQFWGTFKITPSKPVGPDGWKMTVTFPEPGIRRLEVWQAKNQHWNAELEEEKTLEFPFTVTKKNRKRLKGMTVSFERLAEESGSAMSVEWSLN